MKKIVLAAILIAASIYSYAQTSPKEYAIKKIGMYTGRIKVEGKITITDSTLNIKVDYKGNITDATLKIVNRSETPMVSSYQCVGMIGTGDKHVISIFPQQKNAMWKSISSFDNSQAEQWMTIE